MSSLDKIAWIGGTIAAVLLDAVVAVALVAMPLAALVFLDLAPVNLAYWILGFVAFIATLRVLIVSTLKWLAGRS